MADIKIDNPVTNSVFCLGGSIEKSSLVVFTDCDVEDGCPVKVKVGSSLVDMENAEESQHYQNANPVFLEEPGWITVWATNDCGESTSIDIAVASLESLDVLSGAWWWSGPDWYTVKTASSNEVLIEATLYPNDNYIATQKLSWTGGGSAVLDHPRQQSVDKTVPSKISVSALFCYDFKTINVWIVWVELTINISTNGTIDGGNDAEFLNNHSFPYEFGGGNNLGAIDCLSYTNLENYTMGRMQAKAILKPDGIVDLLGKYGWSMDRHVWCIGWNNAGHYVPGDTNWCSGPDPRITTPQEGTNDSSLSEFADNQPDTGSSTNEIFDLDGPGCPPEEAIKNTYQFHANYNQYVRLYVADPPEYAVISDYVPWSYIGLVDLHNTNNTVVTNQLRNYHIALPTNSVYSYQ